MSLTQRVLSIVGLASSDRLHQAEDDIDQLTVDLTSSKSLVASLTNQLNTVTYALSSANATNAVMKDQLQRTAAQRAWCAPHLVEFALATPRNLYNLTNQCLDTILPNSASVYDLIDPVNFDDERRWALYWCLAHASANAIEKGKAPIDENAISGEFLAELERQAKQIPAPLAGKKPVQIAYNAIFSQLKPALKEAQVGADMLLIIAGDGLIAHGFARIFWIQAKRIPDNSLTLNYDQNNSGNYQVDALDKVHAPEKGSFGLYAKYSSGEAYIPAVFVSELLPTTSYIEDLSMIGVRLPELIVAYTKDLPGAGAFANTKALLAYLDEVSQMKPLYIVTVTATATGLDYEQQHTLDQLLSTVSKHYEKRLGLSRNSTNDLTRGPGLSR